MTLSTTAERYGTVSIEHANELLKFTDILIANLNTATENVNKDISNIEKTANNDVIYNLKSDLILHFTKILELFELLCGKRSGQYLEVLTKLENLRNM